MKEGGDAPPPSATDGTPTPPQPDPPMIDNVCANLTPEGVDDSAGVAECPQTVAEALTVVRGAHTLRNRSLRSAIFFGTRNMSGMEFEVEFAVSANMKGEDKSIDLPLPEDYQRRRIKPRRGNTTEVDLQLGYALNVLREGEPAEVHLWARVISPFQTPKAILHTVVVSARLDPDGWIYYFDFPEG